MSRLLAAIMAVLLTSCAGARPAPSAPLFPTAPEWKTLLGDSEGAAVTAPLASDGRHVFVLTRDGTLRALEPDSGEAAWKAEPFPGALSAEPGVVLVRAADGTLTSVHPRTGAVRWQTQTTVAGELPAVIDEDRALVAGDGLAAVELASGRVIWTVRSDARLTAPPARAGGRVLTGEADGTLRCRDRATGAVLWTLRTLRPLLAPPVVDVTRRRLYLGTTDKGIVEVKLDSGKRGWRWTVGADVAHPGLLLPNEILFASFDAVLYAVKRHRLPGSGAGNLVWRGSLPSRPLSGPLAVAGRIVVACLENELVAFAPDTGSKVGSLRTAALIATPPILAGSRLVIGLRDRSVVAYAIPAASPANKDIDPAASGR